MSHVERYDVVRPQQLSESEKSTKQVSNEVMVLRGIGVYIEMDKLYYT